MIGGQGNTYPIALQNVKYILNYQNPLVYNIEEPSLWFAFRYATPATNATHLISFIMAQSSGAGLSNNQS